MKIKRTAPSQNKHKALHCISSKIWKHIRNEERARKRWKILQIFTTNLLFWPRCYKPYYYLIKLEAQTLPMTFRHIGIKFEAFHSLRVCVLMLWMGNGLSIPFQFFIHSMQETTHKKLITMLSSRVHIGIRLHMWHFVEPGGYFYLSHDFLFDDIRQPL